MNKEEILKKIEEIKKLKTEVVKNGEFERAASLRDYELRLKKQLDRLYKDDHTAGNIMPYSRKPL